MRTKYKWYIRPSDAEIKTIWEKGVLTVDANVLLDLYRYNENTRKGLIVGLEQFRGRIWLSHQAASEFFKNRNKVIVSVSKSFEDAAKEISKLRSNLESTIEQLKGNRIVPGNVTEELQTSVGENISNAEKAINIANSKYPDYLKNDPILDKLLNLFDGSVGDNFPEDKLKNMTEEAQRRIDGKIPPGYLDDGKEGDRRYGDFFLWCQILDYAKQKEMPLILVTSERKDDWWETPSGKTVSPRNELLREAMEYTNQRILIYRTERFLQYSAEKSGKKVDKEAVEEIRAININRFKTVEFVAQNIELASAFENKGTLEVVLTRPVYTFTCSGHLDPNMDSPPNVKLRLLESPGNMPAYKLVAGAGTDFDFNAHIKSMGHEINLPAGSYVLEYIAKCEKVE
jgi:hypothetical protein